MPAPPPHRNFIVNTINAIGKMIAPRWPSLDPDDIVKAAIKKAGSDDVGDERVLDALPVLIDAIESESNLHTIGRFGCRQSLIMSLESRIGIYKHRAAHPEIKGVPIEKPLFIVGLPRTGTTILFNLLAQDPANRAPLGWEVQFPHPPPEPSTYTTDPRIKEAEKLFAQMDKLAPTLSAIHEIGSELPQECMPIIAQAFRGPQLAITNNAPRFQQWVDQQDAASGYTYHRHFLEHLQSKYMLDRWVLKSPIHLATLDALLDEYPDARIIFTHRDPAKTIPSLASLVYTLRGTFTDHADPAATGAEQSKWWASALDRSIEVREQHSGKASQFFDLQFEDLVADPVSAIAKVYEHFDIPWSTEISDRMQAFLDDNPRGKHGSHQYELSDFGLDLGTLRQRFDRYCETYNVPLAV